MGDTVLPLVVSVQIFLILHLNSRGLLVSLGSGHLGFLGSLVEPTALEMWSLTSISTMTVGLFP